MVQVPLRDADQPEVDGATGQQRADRRRDVRQCRDEPVARHQLPEQAHQARRRRGRRDGVDPAGVGHRAVHQPGDAAVERGEQHGGALLLEEDAEGQCQQHRRQELEQRPAADVQALRVELRAHLGADVEHQQHTADDADDQVDDLQQPGRRRDVEAGQPVLHGGDQRSTGDQREQATGDDRGRPDHQAEVGGEQLDQHSQHRGRHRRGHELVELRQPALGEEPGEPVAEHRAERGQEEDHPATAHQRGRRARQQSAGHGERALGVRVAVAADLGEAAVRLLQRHLTVGYVGHQAVDARQPVVVGAAAADRTAQRDRVVHQRRLVGDRQQGEGDRRFAAVQPVRVGHSEHRRLDVLGALPAREQQLGDAQGQVEYARRRRPGVGVLLVGAPGAFGHRPLAQRHPDHGAHPVLPGRARPHQVVDHRNAVGRGEGGPRLEGRRLAHPLGQGELGGGVLVLGRRRGDDLQPLGQSELGGGVLVLGVRGRQWYAGGRGESAAGLLRRGPAVLRTAGLGHRAVPRGLQGQARRSSRLQSISRTDVGLPAPGGICPLLLSEDTAGPPSGRGREGGRQV